MKKIDGKITISSNKTGQYQYNRSNKSIISVGRPRKANEETVDSVKLNKLFSQMLWKSKEKGVKSRKKEKRRKGGE